MTALMFVCHACHARYPDPMALYDHWGEQHSGAAQRRDARTAAAAVVASSPLSRATQQRAAAAARARADRAAKGGVPDPPPPPSTPEPRSRTAATWLPPAPYVAALASAKARIAARHGTTVCTVCGTAKGALRQNSDQPYRDRHGRCGACAEGDVLREQLRTAVAS